MKYKTNRSAQAWQSFQDRVTQLGGTVLESSWLGKDVPHRVRCVEGHEVTPRPGSVRQGRGICRACAGLDASVAWARFRDAVAALGGEVLEPEYLGARERHAVRCREGHTTTTVPDGVNQGVGICRYCRGKSWDVFYVVVNEVDQVVKFGITSGTARRRLSRHAADGFDRVDLLVTGLPGNTARDTEDELKNLLQRRGASPLYGTEYFPLRWLPTVMEVAGKLR